MFVVSHPVYGIFVIAAQRTKIIPHCVFEEAVLLLLFFLMSWDVQTNVETGMQLHLEASHHTSNVVPARIRYEIMDLE